ncbi:MBL fold metallo-hydrolase [Alphaproteobacteria bacterium]|nr:MBL fold metallo-hydrolase [Alphaproteobacteria bacterium]|tara:strand:+ start:117 stop:971 length:855 start_codon:yes stop_codon:yes gene_type:complete
MKVKNFYDEVSSTFSYIIIDEDTFKCVIIDPVLVYNQYTGKCSAVNADKLIKFIKENNLICEWVLETHIHADHITAADYIKSKLNIKVGIGEGVKSILDYWVNIFNINHEVPTEGTHFDKLFYDNEVIKIGNLNIKVIKTPGHTPSCVSYLVEDRIFVGDTLLMPNAGTARADFPGGNATTLFKSIKKILSLPSKTKIYICHDYPKILGKHKCVSTVGMQNKNNILINSNVSLSQFIKLRTLRDSKIVPPKMIYPSIQVNIRNGDLGKQESNGKKYIKIPIQPL